MQEKTKAWQQSFGAHLNLSIVELTGDTDTVDFSSLSNADIICTTPEKLGKIACPPLTVLTFWHQNLSATNTCLVLADSITRRKIDQGGARFLAEVLPRSYTDNRLDSWNWTCVPKICILAILKLTLCMHR